MHVEDMPARQMLQEPKQPLVSKAAAFMDRLLLCSHFFFFFCPETIYNIFIPFGLWLEKMIKSHVSLITLFTLETCFFKRSELLNGEVWF
jgi:hypothetical protein